MPTDKHLKLRATPESALGKVISHIQQQPMSNQELASATLQSRFLPFALDQDDPNFRAVAIRCATECEAMARAIREYAQLNTPMISEMAPSSMDYFEHQNLNQNSNSQEVVMDEDEENEDPELEERRKQRRNDDMGF